MLALDHNLVPFDKGGLAEVAGLLYQHTIYTHVLRVVTLYIFIYEPPVTDEGLDELKDEAEQEDDEQCEETALQDGLQGGGTVHDDGVVDVAQGIVRTAGSDQTVVVETFDFQQPPVAAIDLPVGIGVAQLKVGILFVEDIQDLVGELPPVEVGQVGAAGVLAQQPHERFRRILVGTLHHAIECLLSLGQSRLADRLLLPAEVDVIDGEVGTGHTDLGQPFLQVVVGRIDRQVVVVIDLSV